MSLEATIAENTAALRDLIAAIGKGIPTTHAQVAAVVAEAKPEATAKKPDGAAPTAATPPIETTAAVESSQSVAAETGMPAAQAAEALNGHANDDVAAPTYQDAANAINAVAKAKGRAAAVAVLAAFGAAKLPDVKPEQFADVIAAAQKA